MTKFDPKCREAFVAMMKGEALYQEAWARVSLKQKWSGPQDGFAGEYVDNRWKDFQSGWNARSDK